MNGRHSRNENYTTMDTLTDIQGLTIAAENRLRQAGIKSCSELAETSPQEVREILGYLAQGFNVEQWFERAQAFAREHTPKGSLGSVKESPSYGGLETRK